MMMDDGGRWAGGGPLERKGGLAFLWFQYRAALIPSQQERQLLSSAVPVELDTGLHPANPAV